MDGLFPPASYNAEFLGTDLVERRMRGKSNIAKEAGIPPYPPPHVCVTHITSTHRVKGSDTVCINLVFG